MLSQEMGQQAEHEDQQGEEGHTQGELPEAKGCGQEEETKWHSFSVACLACLNTILLHVEPRSIIKLFWSNWTKSAEVWGTCFEKDAGVSAFVWKTCVFLSSQF